MKLFELFKEKFPEMSTKKQDSIFPLLEEKYMANDDPWGLDVSTVKKSILKVWPFYENYFKVRLFGKENVSDTPYMVISNHSGQVAIDGILISTAFITEIIPARILRPMVERFVPKVPFLGSWISEIGGVTGERTSCIKLIEAGQSVLSFPEGVSGISKSTSDFYQLKKFTHGFYRIALKTGIPILPVAVIGAEEMYPLVHQAKSLANKLKLPALPITPLFPWLGPIGMIPLPSPIDIRIGPPIDVSNNIPPDSPDDVIDIKVKEIKDIIEKMIKLGLEEKRPFWWDLK